MAQSIMKKFNPNSVLVKCGIDLRLVISTIQFCKTFTAESGFKSIKRQMKYIVALIVIVILFAVDISFQNICTIRLLRKHIFQTK